MTDVLLSNSGNLLLLLFLGLFFADFDTPPVDDALVQRRSSNSQDARDYPQRGFSLRG
jgi:hypothetical protein